MGYKGTSTSICFLSNRTQLSQSTIRTSPSRNQTTLSSQEQQLSQPSYPTIMCHQEAPKHPACGHAAHGTAWQGSKLVVCRKASSRKTKCSIPSWQPINVNRAYCDHCIARGEMLAQSQGLDPGLYCRRMNVSYDDLEAANPGLFSDAARHDRFAVKPADYRDERTIALISRRCEGMKIA